MSKGIEQIVQNILSDPINLPSPFLDYLIQYSAVNPVPSAAVSAPILNSTGLTGATKASRLVGSTTSGAPTSGTFSVGDLVIAQDGHVWICTAAGSPGTWVDAALATVQASTLDFSGDIHLHSAGNTMEQSSVLTMKSSVADPSSAPSTSWHRSGSLNRLITYTVGYTWTDGTHESALSPTVYVSARSSPTGWSADITVPTFPTGVTGFNIYAYAAGGFRLQSVSLASTYTATMSVYTTTGVIAPTVTSFPAASPAAIKDANGLTLISGDGTVHATGQGGIGYGTGAGGTGTESGAAVTVNKVCGQITLGSHTVNAGTGYTITVTDSSVAATDTPYIVQATGGSTALILTVTAVAAGSFNITFRNISAATNVALDGMVLNYAVIKAVTS